MKFFKKYYEDGSLKEKGHTLNGRKHGICIRYDRNGKFLYRIEYFNGKKKNMKLNVNNIMDNLCI